MKSPSTPLDAHYRVSGGGRRDLGCAVIHGATCFNRLRERLSQTRDADLLTFVDWRANLTAPLPYGAILAKGQFSAQAGEEVVFGKDCAGGVVDADECLDPHHLGEPLFAHL